MPTYDEIAHEKASMSVPLTAQHLHRLGRMCGVHSGSRVLDLSCYRGQLLNYWARDFELRGTGVDEREDAIEIAQTQANDLNVWSQVQYVVADVFEYPQPFHQYNVVSWLTVGAGQDLPRWLAVMQDALRDTSGLLVVGESFWRTRPSRTTLKQMGIPANALPHLEDITTLAHRAKFTVVDMLLLDYADWDAYYTEQWRSVAAWLNENPDDAATPALREKWQAQQQHYFSFEREAVNYGVFVLAGV
jgi:cyclopropane fatty-acyl-phospholipid synthase-like methyltransferase